jgi:hypothetical protein
VQQVDKAVPNAPAWLLASRSTSSVSIQISSNPVEEPSASSDKIEATPLQPQPIIIYVDVETTGSVCPRCRWPRLVVVCIEGLGVRPSMPTCRPAFCSG